MGGLDLGSHLLSYPEGVLVQASIYIASLRSTEWARAI